MWAQRSGKEQVTGTAHRTAHAVRLAIVALLVALAATMPLLLTPCRRHRRRTSWHSQPSVVGADVARVMNARRL